MPDTADVVGGGTRSRQPHVFGEAAADRAGTSEKHGHYTTLSPSDVVSLLSVHHRASTICGRLTVNRLVTDAVAALSVI